MFTGFSNKSNRHPSEIPKTMYKCTILLTVSPNTLIFVFTLPCPTHKARELLQTRQ